MSDDSAVPSFLHAAAGGAGGIVALSMLYPMDNLRTRMQVQQDSLPSMELAQQEAVIVSELKRVLQMASTSKRASELESALRIADDVRREIARRLAELDPSSSSSSASASASASASSPAVAVATQAHLHARAGAESEAGAGEFVGLSYSKNFY